MSTGGGSRIRIRNLDDVWPELEKGLDKLMTNLNEGFPNSDWMTLYTYVIGFVYYFVFFAIFL